MELMTLLGRTAAFSFAAGINLYATVAIIGLASRFSWVELPPQFQIFDSNLVIGAAIALSLLEFFADKVPYVDTVWDLVHTAIRPLGGAFVAVAGVGDASPAAQGMAALLGGSLAAGSHVTKAGTRVMANATPEPFSNWALSFAEDGLVVGLGVLALTHPAAALVLTAVLAGLMLACAATIVRAVRRRFAGAGSIPMAS